MEEEIKELQARVAALEAVVRELTAFAFVNSPALKARLKGKSRFSHAIDEVDPLMSDVHKRYIELFRLLVEDAEACEFQHASD